MGAVLLGGINQRLYLSQGYRILHVRGAAFDKLRQRALGQGSCSSLRPQIWVPSQGVWVGHRSRYGQRGLIVRSEGGNQFASITFYRYLIAPKG